MPAEAFTLMGACSAFGANGANLVLGVLTNAATDATRLAGNVSGGPALQVVNPNAAAGSKALQLVIAKGKAPLVVNPTAGKAHNLNADELDGNNSSDFSPSESYVEKERFFVPSGSDRFFDASCDQGDSTISGGHAVDFEETLVLEDRPSEFSEAWVVRVRTNNLSENLEVYVLCADFPPPRS